MLRNKNDGRKIILCQQWYLWVTYNCSCNSILVVVYGLNCAYISSLFTLCINMCQDTCRGHVYTKKHTCIEPMCQDTHYLANPHDYVLRHLACHTYPCMYPHVQSVMPRTKCVYILVQMCATCIKCVDTHKFHWRGYRCIEVDTHVYGVACHMGTCVYPWIHMWIQVAATCIHVSKHSGETQHYLWILYIIIFTLPIPAANTNLNLKEYIK